MEHSFVLYIDILGFANLCSELDEKVSAIYDQILEMRSHGGTVYEVTILSDTVLVRNKGALDHRASLQFLIEFFRLIEIRLSRLGVFTRAVITHDRYHAEQRDDVFLAYGPAVVGAYNTEKKLRGLGLHLLASAQPANAYYDAIRLDGQSAYFLFTLDCFRLLAEDSFNGIAIPTSILESTDRYYQLPEQVDFYRQISKLSEPDEAFIAELNAGISDGDPAPQVKLDGQAKIREKYRNVIRYYEAKYPSLSRALRENNFSMEVFNDEFEWPQH